MAYGRLAGRVPLRLRLGQGRVLEALDFRRGLRAVLLEYRFTLIETE